MPITLVELRMRRFRAMICQRPRWWEEIWDERRVEAWRAEMREAMGEFAEEMRELREENRRLREENERLRRGY